MLIDNLDCVWFRAAVIHPYMKQTIRDRFGCRIVLHMGMIYLTLDNQARFLKYLIHGPDVCIVDGLKVLVLAA